MRTGALVIALALGFLVIPQGPAQARVGLKVGITMQANEYAAEFARFSGYQIDVVRVFSSGAPPSWSDSRIQQLKAQHIIPFISHKTFDTSAFDAWLRSKPADIPMVYLAFCHECEANQSASTYISQQRAYWNVVQALPSSLRLQYRFGPIQTKQWTENTAGRSYATYDPAVGDFWAVDSYVNSWDLPTKGYPDVSSWMARIDAYQPLCGCTSKWLPELGVVSAPDDVDDTGRAAWINSMRSYLEARPRYAVVLWWQTEGTAGGSVPGLGTRRDFRLHEHYDTTHGTTTPPGTPSLVAWKNFMAGNTP